MTTDLEPQTQMAEIQSEADQNGTTDLPKVPEPFVPAPFVLIVGMTYQLASGDLMKVLETSSGKFLGLVSITGHRPIPQWYEPDGVAERDLVKYPDQDPFDVVSIYHEPHVIYMLRNNMTLEYQSNTCFLSRDAAIKAAMERRLSIVTFKEITE